jgi:hypothetical protein
VKLEPTDYTAAACPDALVTRKDWYSFLSPKQKANLAEEYRRGPVPMQRMGNCWGDGQSVICAGDERQMMQSQAKRFADHFHDTPCPMGHWDPKTGGPPLPSVYDRLVSEGFLRLEYQQPQIEAREGA